MSPFMMSPGASVSLHLQTESGICARCGSTSRVGRGLCLKCLLSAGIDANGEHPSVEPTLDDLLREIDGHDGNWLLGNYQVLEEIGRGGMGVIYRARQRHSHRIVAIKRILSYHADSQETLMRFRREAQAAANLDHPNILPIYEVSEGHDGLPFFSMKFASGGSLLEAAPILRSDPHRAVALMAKVARAVQYAHEQGILHRDLKPGNILLDGRDEPMVSDFGLAKWLEPTGRRSGTLGSWPFDCRSPCFTAGASLAMVATQSNRCRNGCAFISDGNSSERDDFESPDSNPADGKWDSGFAI